MTDKQYNILSKYHRQLYTSYNADYCSLLTSSQLTELLSIYKELFTTNYNICKHCQTSILMMMKQIAKEYFSYEEIHQEKPRRDTTRKGKKVK